MGKYNTFVTLFSLSLLYFISLSSAHMYLNSVWIGGTETKACVRAHPTTAYDSPLSDRNSRRFDTTTDMICGWPPALTQATSSKCSVAAGSTIGLQWWHATPGDDVVDGSHRGPCLVYMARSDAGTGQVWFKIYEEGYNNVTNEFCVDRIRKAGADKGKVFVTIPSDLAAGNYLLRSEFWALHEGYTEYGAQPYSGCLELTVTGGGSATPGNLVNIVGLYTPADPSLLFNIYNGFTSYPSPMQGVPVYRSGTPNPSTSTTGSVTPTNPPSASTTGSQSCSVGGLGCTCAAGNTCNSGLSCQNGICGVASCELGSEKCSCTVGKACDSGLTCLSGLCVNTDSLKGAGMHLSYSTSLFVLFVIIFVAFM